MREGRRERERKNPALCEKMYEALRPLETSKGESRYISPKGCLYLSLEYKASAHFFLLPSTSLHTRKRQREEVRRYRLQC